MPKLKTVSYKGTIGGAISDAFGIFEELGDEMQEAFDNTPENLQDSPVGEARSEAASALSGLTEPDIPTSVEATPLEFQYFQAKGYKSRGKRRDEAVAYLAGVIDALEDLELDEEAEAERDELRDELQNAIDEAENIEFPGMYG